MPVLVVATPIQKRPIERRAHPSPTTPHKHIFSLELQAKTNQVLLGLTAAFPALYDSHQSYRLLMRAYLEGMLFGLRQTFGVSDLQYSFLAGGYSDKLDPFSAEEVHVCDVLVVAEKMLHDFDVGVLGGYGK